MSKWIFGLMAVVFLCAPSFATTDASAENKTEQSTTTNPITGTKTITRRYKKKHNDSAAKGDEKITRKTKVYKDGRTSSTVDHQGSEETK